ncbi:hypothetical protein AMTR_s00043p00208100 [Amborella trichopoda]|uniref:Uncharacterized protein n=1 Tax=Amborella trichopoda TaxID=13333 RepID=W1PX55_AMBTC|nr:hypothetical protein AMTR_s00043p00208100 [Amborella trichopoda]
MALATTGIRVLKGSSDDHVIAGELVPPDLHGVLKTESKAVHRILKVIWPKPNLVHQNMMTDCEGFCWLVIFFMMVNQMSDLVNFNVQCLGELSICRAGHFLLEFLLVAAPLTTIWFFAFTRQ